MLNRVQQQIIDYAQRMGIDPSYMLATAERESSFNPNAGGTGTIRGAYQMTRALRRQYGVPEQGATLEQQNAGFHKYTDDLRKDMARRMGRDPTDSELYMGHHFGPYRASKMASGQYHPNTPVQQIFSPLEMRGNPHFARAGTIGNLTQQTLGDMDRRLGKYNGQKPQDPLLAGGPPGRGQSMLPDDDFSEYAEGYDKTKQASNKGAVDDFSEFAEPSKPQKQAMQPPPAQAQPPEGLIPVRPEDTQKAFGPPADLFHVEPFQLGAM
jgi:hypothetical protein